MFDELPLNRVFSAVQNDAGEIFASDVGNYRILQFDSEGAFVRSFGSRGQGPNEFGSVGIIALNNDKLFAQDTRKLTISSIDMDKGLILDPIHVEWFGSWGIDDSGTIHMSNFHALSADDSPNAISYSRTGEVTGDFLSSYDPIPDLNSVGALPSLHFSPSRAYFAWPYPYRIEILSSDLQPISNFELNDAEFMPPSQPRVVDGMNLGGSLPTQISNILEVDEKWILVEVRYSDMKKPRRVDVFDMDGRYLSYFHLEVGEGISSYSDGMLWSTINGGLLRDVLPYIIGKQLRPTE